MSEPAKIKPRDRDAILQALRAGVVPRLGLQHIQVGRAREVEEVVRDVGRIGQGGAAIRFVIGEYGAGKTFFLNLARLIGLEKKLVVVNADLAPDRRLHASGGQARGLYAELLRNMATRTRPPRPRGVPWRRWCSSASPRWRSWCPATTSPPC